MIDFLSVGIGRFRKFGFPYQIRVNSQDEIVNAIQTYNGIANCYLSISEHQEINGQVYTIPLFYLMDFDLADSYSLSDIETEVATVLNWLESERLNYQLDFSGRGYHILIELSQNKRIHTFHFREFYYYITSHLNLKTLDIACSEIMRIKRIPETVNLKSNKLCATLFKKEGKLLNLFDYIKDIECENKSYYEIGDYENLIGQSRFIFPFDTNLNMPCIFDEVNHSETSHKVRWMWVKIMQHRGYSIHEIFEKAKNHHWNDFNPEITAYQIKYTMSHNYTIKCSKDICKEGCKLRNWLKESKETDFS